MVFALDHLSCACALGRTNEEVLANLRAGRAPGMVEIAGDVPGRSLWFGRVPGELPAIEEPEWNFRSNRLIAHAVEQAHGAYQALVGKYGASRVAVVLGSSNTGIDEAQNHVEHWLAEGVPPAAFRFSMIELGTTAEYLAQAIGAKGPAYVVSTACSSSAKAFVSARRLLEAGVADAVVTGGVDGRCRFAMNGFHALGALAAGRCRPLAADRDGINLGEGVALFALARADEDAAGVVLAGCGETSDAYHPTAPDPEGAGAEAAMRAALADAGRRPDEIVYVNLHGTGTPANDAMEMKAVERVFGPSSRARKVESTKHLTGHCLGAAGAVEAALCWLKIACGDAPGACLSNSFAFGGSNASVVLEPGMGGAKGFVGDPQKAKNTLKGTRIVV